MISYHKLCYLTCGFFRFVLFSVFLFSCFFYFCFFFFKDKISMLGFLTLGMVKGGITPDAFTQKVAATGWGSSRNSARPANQSRHQQDCHCLPKQWQYLQQDWPQAHQASQNRRVAATLNSAVAAAACTLLSSLDPHKRCYCWQRCRSTSTFTRPGLKIKQKKACIFSQ